MRFTRRLEATALGLVALLMPLSAAAQVAVAPAAAIEDTPESPDQDQPPTPAQQKYESSVTEFTVEDEQRWRLEPRCERADMRALLGLGVGLAVQGGGMFLTLLIGGLAGMATHDHSDGSESYFWDEDRKIVIIGSVYLGLSTIIGSTAFKIVTKSGQCWKASWGGIFLGGLLGAGSAWGAGFAYLQSGSENRGLAILTLVALPIVLPALGELFGYLASREPTEVLKNEASRSNPVSYTPPSPTVIIAQDGSGRALPGISFGQLRF